MSDARPDLFEPTVRKEAAAQFRRARPALRWVGVLTSMAGRPARKVRVEHDTVTLGRDKALPSPIDDESVSRHHARLRRDGEEFVLEDLGSFNGTHVDGVPVLVCVLQDGDAVQIGQTLYYFERVLEPTPPAPGEPR